jgi:hypothetical protein
MAACIILWRMSLRPASRWLLLPALVGLLLAPLLVIAWSASAFEGQKVGRISALQGRATVLRQGVDRPDQLEMDSPLYRADTVQTATASKARLSLDDDTVVTMGELTTLRIVRAGTAQAGAAARVSVATGVARLVAQHVPGRAHAEAVTPTAVAAVRGTEWLLDVSGRGTGILVVAGQVVVSNARREIKGTVVLKPGEGTDVAPGKAPTPPATWSASRRDALDKATTLP